MKIMKFVSFFSKAFVGTALLGSLFVSSCTKDNSDDVKTNYTVSGNASGSQMSPAVTTTGIGNLNGSYNSTNNTLTYSINWTTLSGVATNVRLYGPAAAGTNASVLSTLTISTPGASGTASGTVTLSDSEETYLIAGQLYYTVATATNVDGEVRGQITASPQ